MNSDSPPSDSKRDPKLQRFLECLAQLLARCWIDRQQHRAAPPHDSRRAKRRRVSD